eukprot:CAMPEP_0204550266 /NCGR_PEP_ID=MMETSP0661-20131031/24997_1 /ASSEMBLY_ACC=CAM_ASM_000606 /TAXON_ID=109239 /ORGANISM="Alexandrium margalefi, Strain AMGDE01CS-322" /LENGTH=168 /DNA_ID=CAMNT_0051557221 /DNA_START=74 /DNA_END=577 /DNA_ORIENTATION=-
MVNGVIDSEDMPLYILREKLLQHKIVHAINEDRVQPSRELPKDRPAVKMIVGDTAWQKVTMMYDELDVRMISIARRLVDDHRSGMAIAWGLRWSLDLTRMLLRAGVRDRMFNAAMAFMLSVQRGGHPREDGACGGLSLREADDRPAVTCRLRGQSAWPALGRLTAGGA